MILLSEFPEIKRYLDEITLKSSKDARNTYEGNLIKYTSELISKPIYFEEKEIRTDKDGEVLLKGEGYSIVFYKDRSNYDSDLFLLGHELGHILIGHYNLKYLSKFSKLRKDPLMRMCFLVDKKTHKKFILPVEKKKMLNEKFWIRKSLCERLCDEIGDYTSSRLYDNELSKNQLSFDF